MWSTNTYFRQTRKGKILKHVTENYLRDDIFFGTQLSSNGSASGPTIISNTMDLMQILLSNTIILVVDTNVLLHHMDLLEHALHRKACPNIVIPQTALMECKRHSMPAFTRAIDLLKEDSSKRCGIFFANEHHVECQIDEAYFRKLKLANLATDNDLNDARIRMVAEYFGTQLSDVSVGGQSAVQVVLLTDDVGCRKLARKEQKERFGKENAAYECQSVKFHVQQLKTTGNNNSDNDNALLMDLVAQLSTGGVGSTAVASDIFAPHLKLSDITLGVKQGLYYQGTLRCERGTHERCYVNIRRGEERVAVTIVGSQDINRAVDGDVVVIELHPMDRWLNRVSDLDVTNNSKTKSKEKDVAGVAISETAEPSIRDESNVQDTIAVGGNGEDGEDQVFVARRPTGKVIGIVRRQFRRDFCGSIYTLQSRNTSQDGDDTSMEDEDSKNMNNEEQPHSTERDEIAKNHEVEHADGSSSCVFFAVDKRIPPILIRTTQRERLIGRRILVSIDSWPVDSRYPLGHYVRTLGRIGEKHVETDVLLHEHNIPCEPFSAKVLACLPPADYKIELKEEDSYRKDLRHLPVLSIDPPGCKDIDDALHCIVLPNNNWQIGVHIADVTHYVKANSPLDVEAANRSTSTYLVARRLDMLPSLLTTDLCSLKGNVDRFAFSILWEVTPEGKIIDVEFHKSIIHSIAALTYEQAQTLIDQPDGNAESDIKCGAVKRLAAIARIMRDKRIRAGALTLASPEVKFVLDSESLNPTDVMSYALFEANAVVEEFMLLANVTVGKKILRHYPTLSVLRRHPAPNKAMFDDLISKARSRGFEINIDDSKRLADSLDAAIIESDPYFNKILRILSTRCMSPAQYFCSGEYRPQDWHHYGLAAPVYTHFTSPIRRYADVCVHRLLAAAIGVAPLPVQLSSKSYLHDLAANMNRRHRSAQMAGRASVQLHTLIFFSGEAGGVTVDAYVLDVDTTYTEGVKPALRVIVPRYGIEGRVELNDVDADDPRLVRHEGLHKIQYCDENDTKKTLAEIRVFDKVQVKIWVKELVDGKQLMIDLVEPKFGSA